MDADEAEAEALDRNWNELLQELRVTQTGLQILTGFLLTLPFQQRFSQLDTFERGVYLGALAVTVTATVLVLAPAHFHRMLFRQQEKPWMVLAGNRCALASLYLSAVAVTTVTFLLFDVVLGRAAGAVAAGVAALAFLGVWWGVPLLTRRRSALRRTPRRSPRA
jgi:hypothetical protein